MRTRHSIGYTANVSEQKIRCATRIRVVFFSRRRDGLVVCRLRNRCQHNEANRQPQRHLHTSARAKGGARGHSRSLPTFGRRHDRSCKFAVINVHRADDANLTPPRCARGRSHVFAASAYAFDVAVGHRRRRPAGASFVRQMLLHDRITARARVSSSSSSSSWSSAKMLRRRRVKISRNAPPARVFMLLRVCSRR